MDCPHRDYCTVLVDCPTVSCGLAEFMDALRSWGLEHGVRQDNGSEEDRARLAIGVTELYCDVCGFDHRAPSLETTLYHTLTGLSCNPLAIEEAQKRAKDRKAVLRTHRWGEHESTRLTKMSATRARIEITARATTLRTS